MFNLTLTRVSCRLALTVGGYVKPIPQVKLCRFDNPLELFNENISGMFQGLNIGYLANCVCAEWSCLFIRFREANVDSMLTASCINVREDVALSSF